MKLMLASSGFALGSAAAAALFSGPADRRAAAATHIVAPAAFIASGRIPITRAESNEALAAGNIDRPIKTILDVRTPMAYGDFHWDDKAVPAGPAWIRVDLQSQIISVFRSGHEIGTAVILYGADGVPTPVGKFPILAKLKDHRSATYNGAPMPYTLRLTGDGVSIHGSNVRWGFATHGCIGIPTAFAAKLFNAVKPGDEVLVISGEARTKPQAV